MAKKKRRTPEERARLVAALKRLMAKGGSNKSAARRLGVSPGVVAGLRTREKIPSTHSSALEVGFTTRAKSASGRVLKLTTREDLQCEAKVDGRRCPYIKEPDSRYCGLPQHQALEKKRGAS